MSIIDYINNLLHDCKRNPNECYLHQAYGAINYHIMTREHDPKEDNELFERWTNEWKPTFENIIYGVWSVKENV